MYKAGFTEGFEEITRSSDASLACTGMTSETRPISSKKINWGDDNNIEGHLMAKTPAVQVTSTTGSLGTAASDVTPAML